MDNLVKKLKVKDGIQNKFLAADSNGEMVSTDIGTDDIQDLVNRIQALEGTSQNLSTKIVDINGETV